MSIYRSQSKWKLTMTIIGVLLLLMSLWYSNYLAKSLAESETQNRELYVQALRTIAESKNFEDDIGLENKVIQGFSLPVVSKDKQGNHLGNNWGAAKDTSQIFLAMKFEEGIRNNMEPIQGTGYAEGVEILIFNGPLYKYIKLFPIVQLVFLAIFGALGYFLFDTARKSEQNRVWAGMAKETAHQLGTPISAMLAWMDLLRESNVDRPDQLEVVDELGKDVERLELIADRFSKIGSDPELVQSNLYDQLDDIEGYMKRRASRRVNFDFPKDKSPLFININEHLFIWVLENLIRNALDAMDGQGTISMNVEIESAWIKLFLSDTGKGMPSSDYKEVFKPGFSTKKRGWGLGLSLAKRIIEEYHKGKIFVKHSKLNEGTTFAIYLPKP